MEHTKQRRTAAAWHKGNRVLMTLIALMALGLLGASFYPQWQHHNQLAAQLDEDRAKLRAEQLLQKQREREMHLLQTDADYIETIARDKLGVMKDGETIFRLESSKTAKPALGR